MAKATESDEKRKPSRGTRMGGYVLLGLLVVGLAGFSASNFGGTVSTIGQVGDVKITTSDYARALRGEMQEIAQQFGMRLDPQQFLAMGFGDKVLAELVAQATLDAEAGRIGVSAGNATVATELMKQSAFGNASGAFDPAIYRRTLEMNGWSVADYEDMLRRSVGRTLLQGAVSGGMTVPEEIVAALHRHEAESRSFAMLKLSESDLTSPLAEADEAAEKAWYEANIDRFTRPEGKKLRFVALMPEAFAASQSVDEAAIEKRYNERISEFVTPERRLVERLVYPDAESRDAALASLGAGRSFEDLVSERGLSLQNVDMGDVTEAELGAAAAAVFAADDGSVVAGDSDLGPALFRINGRLEGSEVSLEEAREEIAAEIRLEAARRDVAAKIDEIDDLLAGGESFEAIANLMQAEIGTIDYIPGHGGDHPVEGYAAFQSEAQKIGPGGTTDAILLDDGGIVALEYLEALPAAPIPFETAREEVSEALRAENLRKALRARAEEIKAAVEAGNSLASQGVVDVTRRIDRDGVIAGAPQGLVRDIFAMAEGELRLVESGDFIALIQLTGITPADEDSEEARALRDQIAGGMRGSLAQDTLAAFIDATGRATGVTLDRTAINLVNTSLQ